MKVYPLKSLTLEEAAQKQFRLVDEMTKVFKGEESLSLGDLGIHPDFNAPKTTIKVENVIANFFKSEASIFVRGAGTGAIKEALCSVLKPNDNLLVHTAEIYSTTKTTIEQCGFKIVQADFNNLDEIKKILTASIEVKAALVQTTRQSIHDSYQIDKVIETIKSTKDIPVITDDNYAVMKIDKIGAQVNADLSCFSCFKLLGPEGIGMVVGKKEYIDKIRSFHYSGGSQTQGYQALEALRGMIFSPVTHALQAIESEKIIDKLNSGAIEKVKSAIIVNAQSKVILVEFKEPIAKEVLRRSNELGAAPYPIGAESKYEMVPMFYRLSGTMRAEKEEYTTHWIRINPMRSSAETVLRILEEATK